MRVPSSELPNIERIRTWAGENLPDHYRLLDVRCAYGTDFPRVLPEDWEISIDYVNSLDPCMMGSPDEIDAYHSWADPLIAKIRAEWPASTVRIGINKRLAKNG